MPCRQEEGDCTAKEQRLQGGWQTSEGSEGEQRDFPMGKIPLTAQGRCWQRDSMAQRAVQGDYTAQCAVAWCPSQLHGTVWHSTVGNSSAKQLAQPLCGTHCTDLPAAWHSWGQPEPPACSWASCATAHPKHRGTLTGEQSTPVPSREGIKGGTAAMRNS